MIKNIKTDIIYYNAQKDFEFEFTLCAACRMRLLTDMATDKNSLLLSLSRSVSRSQIVILYSDLTDDFVRTIAEAIGYNTEEIDYDKYGITFYENRASIENAVPLATSEGRFGGLILESGPQSLIFISSDKAISKEIMKTYVYQYIKDVSEMSSETIAPAPAQEVTLPESTDIKEEPVYEPIEIEAVADTEEPITEEIPQTINETQNDFLIENIMTDTHPYNDYEEEQIISEKAAPEPTKKRIDLPSIILTIILFLLVGFIVYLLVIEPLSNGISVIDNIKQLFGLTQ